MYHYKNKSKVMFFVHGKNKVYRIIRGRNTLDEKIDHPDLELLYHDEPVKCIQPATLPEQTYDNDLNIEEIELDEKPRKTRKNKHGNK